MVVIPARNAAHTLAEQLQALARQDYTGPWRVVVVDNGSTDGTSAVAEQFREHLPSLDIVDAPDAHSAAHARNAGSARAGDDELIAYCDADDVVMPGWLTGLVAEASEDRIVAGAFDEDSLNDPVVRRWVDPPAGDGLPRHLGFLPAVRSSNMAVPARLLRRLGGWPDVPYGEDVELSWDAQLAGCHVALAEAAVVKYRFRHDLGGLARQAQKAGLSDATLYAKYAPHGLVTPTLRRTFRVWAWLALRLPWALVDLGWRGRWVRAAAYRVGRLQGSIRHRVFAL